MKIYLLLTVALVHFKLYGQFFPAADQRTPAYLYQSYGPIQFDGLPLSDRGKSVVFRVKNIWALSNVNLLDLQFQKVTSYWNRGLYASAFIHPGCQDFQIHGKASTQIGHFSSLGLQLGVGYTTWLNQTQNWRPLVILHYGMHKKKFFFECNTHLAKKLHAISENPISPVWQTVLSLQITPELAVQGNSILTDSGVRNAQFGIVWKCNKQWLVSCAIIHPTWGWSVGMAWLLPHRQQGWGYQQSAWIRPNMEYWIRFSEK
jgi:hypothetical protein